MPITINRDAFPLTVNRFEGVITPAELAAYLGELDALFAAGHTIASVVVTAQIVRPDRAMVRQHAEWFKARREILARQWLGISLVITSPVLRFLFSSLLLLSPLPMPYVVEESAERARAWAEEKLRAAGLAAKTSTPGG
jgi:hypothetical protein